MVTKFKNSYFAYFLMYNFYFLSWALFSTLISVNLLDLGYKPSQVSLVVSISFLTSMLTQPLIGVLTDRHNHKHVLVGLFALSLLGGLGMVLAKSFWAIMFCYSFVMLLMNGSNPLLEQLATTSRFPYGKLRIWGTIGFAIGSQIAGLLYQWISPEAVYLGFSAMVSLAIIGVMGTEIHEESHDEEEVAKVPLSDFLKNKGFVSFTVISILLSGVLMTGHTYIPAYLESSGLTVAQSTTVVAISVICEAPLTYFSYLFMDRFKTKQLMYAAFLLLVIQLGVYSLDLGLISKVAVTLLSKHTAGMLFIMVNMKAVNSLVSKKVLITSLAIMQTARNLGAIIFQNIAGFILDDWSYQYMFTFLLVMVIVIAILVHFSPLPDGTDETLFH
ncbi:MFS transporter [Streptococcus fryi]